MMADGKSASVIAYAFGEENIRDNNGHTITAKWVSSNGSAARKTASRVQKIVVSPIREKPSTSTTTADPFLKQIFSSQELTDSKKLKMVQAYLEG